MPSASSRRASSMMGVSATGGSVYSQRSVAAWITAVTAPAKARAKNEPAAVPVRSVMAVRQLVLHHGQRLQVLAAQHRGTGDQPYAGDPLRVGDGAGRGVHRQHRVPDSGPEALAGGPFAQGVADPGRPVQRQRADRLVLAAEIIVERPRGDVRRRRDVLDEHVLQAPLDGQAHGSRAQGLPGGALLALAQAGLLRRSRRVHATSIRIIADHANLPLAKIKRARLPRSGPPAALRPAPRSGPPSHRLRADFSGCPAVRAKNSARRWGWAVWGDLSGFLTGEPAPRRVRAPSDGRSAVGRAFRLNSMKRGLP